MPKPISNCYGLFKTLYERAHAPLRTPPLICDDQGQLRKPENPEEQLGSDGWETLPFIV